MSNRKLFYLVMFVTTGTLLGYMWLGNLEGERRRIPKLVHLNEGVLVTSQLRPVNVRHLRLPAKTLVDIRPDGEDPDQPPSSEMELAAKERGIAFFYLPVPHEGIPDGTVDALSKVLSEQTGPALLYCRTGRRAARAFALVEASRPRGPEIGEILNMVRNAGFSADDLKEEIAQRISRRHPVPPDKD